MTDDELLREIAILKSPAYGLTRESPHQPLSLTHAETLARLEFLARKNGTKFTTQTK